MAEGTRYRAIRKIAEGGSAQVYLAEQLGAAGFKRQVVLKRIRAELYADAAYREMLLEEAKLAMSLHHSNLVEVLDLGEAGGHYFLVLELVDGWTLQHVLRRGRDLGLPLPPALAVYIAAELCRGLAYAHERSEDGQPLGIVHRDVCPNNVLLSTHAEVKLIDFGIARARNRAAHTGLGRTRGKPAWMSPEQARAEPLDARSDLYSVGSVLFAMLTDSPPFSATDDLAVLTLVSRGNAPSPALVRPDLPEVLCALVVRAMAKRPEERFASAQELLLALEQLQRGAPQPAGRSELQNYLRMLSARDGDSAITGQPLPPAMAMNPPELIALSREQTIATEPPARSRRRRRLAMVAALLVLAPLGGWFQQRLGQAPVVVTMPMPVAVVTEGPAAAPVEPAPEVVQPPLQISARLAPRQRAPGRVAVLFESHPAGAMIKVDDRELGRTPTTLQLRNGREYELEFEARGNAPVRQRLLLTPREGRLPKVTLDQN